MRTGRIYIVLIGCLYLSLLGESKAADDVYQKPSEFIRETFDGEIPQAGVVSLSTTDLARIKRFMPGGYGVRKVRYWSEKGRTAWILSAIGKTKPITVGYVVNDGAIEEVKVLIYRESHGYEVKEKFFTRQFQNAQLEEERKLDRKVDNIVGATLSVRALTRMALLALYLDQKLEQP